MWRIFKTPENRVLKIEGDDGIESLYPGNFYHLTVIIHGHGNDGMSGEAKITVKYQWDGKTLRRVKH